MEITNLSEKELNLLFEASRVSPRRRISKNFQEDSYSGPQLGLNIIQPDSYIRPHLRFSDEHILHYSGKLCSLILDEKGSLIGRQMLNNKSPYFFLPAGTYSTVISFEEGSGLWFVTQGPFNPNHFRQDLPCSPTEKEDYEEYFNWLRKMALTTRELTEFKRQ